ncbi:permease [Streptomyces sp. NPDC048516]|uniref:permease n=1 Tax=Streptomyces sp. NPDC048516 TaxID=3365565 RepID=UPI003722B8D4
MSTVAGQTPGADAAAPERRGVLLWWRWVRIGCAAGRDGTGGRLGFWARYAASAAVAVVALAAVATIATYDGRAARNQARGPVITERQQDAVALWREGFDSVGKVAHSVVYLRPLKPGAQPPPGLTRWPAPGEVMLSPELVRAGQHEGITNRYGHYAGMIGRSGLVSPSERLAYVGPSHAPDARERESWSYARGFGQSYPMGESLYTRPLTHALLALGVLTGVPALALLVVAARAGSRGRRSGPSPTPGGTPCHRAAVRIGEAVRPTAAGTALAALPMLGAMTTDLRIPATGYLLNSGDLRSAWPMALAALVLSFTVTLVAVAVLPSPACRGAATGRRSSAATVPRWRPAGCGLGLAAVVFSQYLVGPAGLCTFIGGTVVMWALLPSVATVASRALGAKLAAHGLRTGRPGRLVGGRWTVAHPGVVVRPAVALIIGLGLVCQLQIANSDVGEKATAARATEARIGDGVLNVQSRDLPPSAIEALSGSLPAGTHVLGLTMDLDQQGALLQGSCRTVRTLGLGCPATPRAVTGGDLRVTEIRDWYGRLRVQAAPSGLRLDRLRGSLLVISDGPARRAAVERAAYSLAPAVNVEAPGETWLVGAGTKTRLNNWVLLFGSLGLALLLLAGGFSAAAEFARVRHTLVPLADPAGGHTVLRAAAGWHLAVPLLVSTMIAVVVTAWHAGFLTAVLGTGTYSWCLLAAALCGGGLMAAVVTVLGGRSAIRAAQRG